MVLIIQESRCPVLLPNRCQNNRHLDKLARSKCYYRDKHYDHHRLYRCHQCLATVNANSGCIKVMKLNVINSDHLIM
jgi:hypothetical protein